MEKAARGRRHPRTADDLSRLIVTTLLLLGGAFVLGLTWSVRQYHVFTDRTAALIPDSAEFVLTVPLSEGLSSVVGRFEGRFGRALDAVRFRPGTSLTLVVDRNVDNGKEGWHLITDAPVDGEAVPDSLRMAAIGPVTVISTHETQPLESVDTKGRLRLIRRASGEGWVKTSYLAGFSDLARNDSGRLPVRAGFEDGIIRIETGNRLRGPDAADEFPSERRRIAFVPDLLAAYTIFTPGEPDIPGGGFYLDSPLNAALKAGNRMTEIAVTDEGAFAALMHESRGPAPLLEAIEQPFIDDLAIIEPETLTHVLPDGTRMTELRLNEAEVTHEEKALPGDILMRTYSSADGRAISFLLYPDGRIWMTDSPLLVSSLLTLSDQLLDKGSSCEPNSLKPGATLDTKAATHTVLGDRIDLFGSFKAISYRIEDGETGLFTFCGYF